MHTKNLVVRNYSIDGRLQMFFKINVLHNLANFKGKHLCKSLFLIKFAAAKYFIIVFFKEEVIILCQITFKTKRVPSWYGLDLFKIPSKNILKEKKLYYAIFLERR